jgi:nucleoside-diphosphate-sugar epimerase
MAPPVAPAFHVDVKWLAAEAAVAATKSAPKRPVVVGGSGLLGSNLVVFLANVPGVENISIVDMRPPKKEVCDAVLEAGLDVHFIEYCLGGDDNQEVLESVLKTSDCVFSTVTPHVQYATEEQFYATNEKGVKILLEACQSMGVPRLVHLSSIAVTNHFADSLNQKETDPLPPIETFESPYDISKRRGEQAVLSANGSLATCCIRAGGIMLSPWDFCFANLWPVIPGLIIQPRGKSIDFMDGRDVCRALLMAAQGLQDRPAEIAGEAFFVTKGTSIPPGGVSKVGAKYLGVPFIHVPDLVISCAYWFVLLYHLVRKSCGCKVPGIPPHRFLQMLYSEKTYDNTKAREILGFTPKLDLDDSVSRIVSLYLQEQGSAPRSTGRSIFFAHASFLVLMLSCLIYLLNLLGATL